MVYRYLGSESAIGDVMLRSFGQQITLSEELAKDAIEGGCPLLPEEDFEAIGFTPEELKQFAKPGPRMNAPESFQVKVSAALMAAHELKEGKANG